MSPGNPTQEKLRRAVEQRFLRIAFHHLLDGEMDIRGGLLLHRAEMLPDGIPIGPIDTEILDAVQEPGHSRRMPTPNGPYVFIRHRDLNRNPEVVFLLDLICHPQADARHAALLQLESTATNSDGFLSPHSERLLQEYAADLRSSDPKLWTTAALRLDGELIHDFKLNLAAFRQSLAMRFDQGIQTHWKLIQTPSIDALFSIDDDHYSFIKGPHELEEFTQRLLNESSTFTDVLNRYDATLGHLPLHPDIGFGGFIRRWRAVHPDAGSFQELFAWAEANHSAVRRIHACNVCLMNSETLTPADRLRFWETYTGLVGPIPEDSPWFTVRAALAIEADLARMFLQYLESHTFSMDVDRLATVSWWAARRIAEVIADDALTRNDADSYLVRIGSKILPDILNSAQYRWMMTQAGVSSSRIRFATLYIREPRLLELLLCMQRIEDGFPPDSPDADQRDIITGAFDRTIVTCFPLQTEDATDGPWAFDQTLQPAYKNWIRLALDEDAHAQRKGLIEFCDSLSALDHRLEAIRHLSNPKQKQRAFLVHLLHILAATSEADATGICRITDEAKWCDAVIRNLDTDELDVLIQALLKLCSRPDCTLPQRLGPALANIALDGTEIIERRKTCFELSILCAAALGKVTALRTILASPARREFEDVVAKWQAFLPQVMLQAPPLLIAQIRDVLASLRSIE